MLEKVEKQRPIFFAIYVHYVFLYYKKCVWTFGFKNMTIHVCIYLITLTHTHTHTLLSYTSCLYVLLFQELPYSLSCPCFLNDCSGLTNQLITCLYLFMEGGRLVIFFRPCAALQAVRFEIKKSLITLHTHTHSSVVYAMSHVLLFYCQVAWPCQVSVAYLMSTLLRCLHWLNKRSLYPSIPAHARWLFCHIFLGKAGFVRCCHPIRLEMKKRLITLLLRIQIIKEILLFASK